MRIARVLAVQAPDKEPPSLVPERRTTPDLAPHQVLVEVANMGLSSLDVQAFDANLFGHGALLGHEFSGRVLEVGPEVTRVAVGDAIAGLTWGPLGSYGSLTLAHESICFKLDGIISFPRASAVLLGSLTAFLALFSKRCLNIELDPKANIRILIWGGGTSVGFFAIQIAALYGFKVVTTCSPRHFERVKALGAERFFDYHDEDVIEKIKAAVPCINYVFDAIGNQTSSGLASQALGRGGGRLCTVRPGKAFTTNVAKNTEVTGVLVWNCFPEPHYLGGHHWPADEADHELAAQFCEQLPALIEEERIKSMNVHVFPGGLEYVKKGFDFYRNGEVSGFKVVFEP